MSANKSGPRRPMPSRAGRTYRKIKHSGSIVGQFTFGEDVGQGQAVVFESHLECKTAIVALHAPGVVDIVEQVGCSPSALLGHLS